MPKKKLTEARTLVLLDVHAIVHRAYHALPDFTSPTGEPTGALYGVVSMLLKIIDTLKPTAIVACYDLPDPTYRHEVFAEYKAGRAKTDDALAAQLNRSRDIFTAFGIPMYEVKGFEADDMLGTIVAQTKDITDLRVIIASGDMDTLQLVSGARVMVYTLRKGINDTVLYDEAAVKARYQFAPRQVIEYKGLRGDPSDNIPGVPGIGEKTATELLQHFKSIDALYRVLKKDPDQVRAVGIRDRIINILLEHEEEAQFSKMLATIRTDAPIQFTLPEKTWRELVDEEKVSTLCRDLGFRTLAVRIAELLDLPPPPQTVDTSEVPDVSPEEVLKAGLGVWLLSSETTNPTYDDIMQFGRSHNASTFADTVACIERELKAAHLDTVYRDIELPLMQVLRRMEQTGIRVDIPYLKKLSKRMHTESEACAKRIYGFAEATFNINSPKQLGDILYDTLGLKPRYQKRTATGQRSTKESELEKLRDVHPIINEILQYRELQKLVSTYVDPLITYVDAEDRIHTTFLQAGSVTGRMASQNPGVQNIPIRTEAGRAIRHAFIPREGYTLVSIDYSQVELRVAAFLSGDEKMIDIFKRGEDVHRGVAAQVFGVAAAEVTPDMRRRAKIINFGILYGMGVNALRTNLGEDTSRAEAQEFLNAYFSSFTRLALYLEETKEQARNKGYTETLFGRRRYFPGMNSSLPFIRAQAERMAINAPIQGTSADIIRVAMVRIDEHIRKQQWERAVFMTVQVHDELVFEIASDLVHDYAPQLKKIMERIVAPEQTAGVPLVADIKVGENWEEMTPL